MHDTTSHGTENVVYEFIETVDLDEDQLLGKILHPNGTRDFPNGGSIQVRNPSATVDGRYRYRLGAGGVWVDRHIPARQVQGYQAAGTSFYIKNIGTIDLDVTP